MAASGDLDEKVVSFCNNCTEMTKTAIRESEQTITDNKLVTGTSSVEKGKKGSQQEEQVPIERTGPVYGNGEQIDISKSPNKDRDKATDIVLKNDGDPPRIHVISDIDVDGKELGLKVLWVEKADSTERDGGLRINDRITEVNEIHLGGVCFYKAQKIFWDAMRSGDVRLKVIKYPGQTPFPKRKPPPIRPKSTGRAPVKPPPLPPKRDMSPQSSPEKTSEKQEVPARDPVNDSNGNGDVSTSHHKERDKAIEEVMTVDDVPPEIPFISNIDDDGRDKAIEVVVTTDDGRPEITFISDIVDDRRELGLKVQNVGMTGEISTLQVNDRIIEVNGTRLDGVSFESSQKLFWEAVKSSEVRLKVIKNEGPPPLSERKRLKVIKDEGPPPLPELKRKLDLKIQGSSHQLPQRQETSNQPLPSPVHGGTDQLQSFSDQNQKLSEDQSDPPNLPPRPTSGHNLYSSPNKEAKNQPTSPSTPNKEVPTPPSGPPPTHRKQAEAKPLSFFFEIPVKQIKKGPEIRRGEYNLVLKGTYITQKKKFKNDKIDVALKTFHEGSVENASGLLDEARVMQSLDHPCILRLLGVCNGPPLMLVEEFVPMGSMLDFLLDHEEEIDVKTDLYLWASQIAIGMKYLESQRLVHRNLAARNILLQTKKQIKISDFGLSRVVGNDSDYYEATHGGRWPIKWYPPESVNYGIFAHASDVWSYGVTLWEMFSFGEPPYGDMKGIEVVQYIERGHRLLKPEKCPGTVYDVMMKCWSCKPEQRPYFHFLADHFQDEPDYASIQDLLKKCDR